MDGYDTGDPTSAAMNIMLLQCHVFLLSTLEERS
jgi:hypothetical protein